MDEPSCVAERVRRRMYGNKVSPEVEVTPERSLPRVVEHFAPDVKINTPASRPRSTEVCDAPSPVLLKKSTASYCASLSSVNHVWSSVWSNAIWRDGPPCTSASTAVGMESWRKSRVAEYMRMRAVFSWVELVVCAMTRSDTR